MKPIRSEDGQHSSSIQRVGTLVGDVSKVFREFAKEVGFKLEVKNDR